MNKYSPKIFILLDLISDQATMHFINGTRERTFQDKVYIPARFEITMEREIPESIFEPLQGQMRGTLALQLPGEFNPWASRLKCFIRYTQEGVAGFLYEEGFDAYLEKTEYNIEKGTTHFFILIPDQSETTIEAVKTLSPPPDIQGFKYLYYKNDIHFSWDPINSLDPVLYCIRYTPDLNNPQWEKAQSLITSQKNSTFFDGDLFKSGSYLIKALDILGNFSVNAAYCTIVSRISFVTMEVEKIRPMATTERNKRVSKKADPSLPDLTNRTKRRFNFE
jgi:hypothetical protein